MGGARGPGKTLKNAKDGGNVKQLLRVINPIRPPYCEPNSLPCRLYHARRTPASPGRTPSTHVEHSPDHLIIGTADPPTTGHRIHSNTGPDRGLPQLRDCNNTLAPFTGGQAIDASVRCKPTQGCLASLPRLLPWPSSSPHPRPSPRERNCSCHWGSWSNQFVSEYFN